MHSWSIFALVTLCVYGFCCANSVPKVAQISINSTDSISGNSSKHVYTLYYSKVNWFNAWLSCRERGAYLASFKDRAELHEFSVELDKLNCGDMPYIDGTSLGQKGNFRWYQNAERVNGDLFDKGQPDNPSSERCLVLWFNSKVEYLINNVSCDEQHYFVCQN